MTAATAQKDNSTAAIIFAVFAIACVVAFLFFRGNDVGQIPSLVGNLGGGPIFGSGLLANLFGSITAFAVAGAWWSTGTLLLALLDRKDSLRPETSWLRAVIAFGAGAAIWSIIWFFLGIAGLYSVGVAVIAIPIALLTGLGVLRSIRSTPNDEARKGDTTSYSILERCLLVLIFVQTILSFIATIAPPTAKDTLLYHFAVPKAFVAQGNSNFIDGNIASFLALGTEMQVVWARLLGSTDRPDVVSGAIVWMFFPLLLLAVYGLTRELNVSRLNSLIAVAMVATIPTAYYVATSGYIDLSLALYITLATYALTRWWNEQTWNWAVLVAIFLGAALSVKLTALFVFAAFALTILLKARGAQPGRILATGFGALLLAGVIASPWYIRTWIATGSPVFPFYMSIWPGKANGWDLERSNLFQSLNSQYGGTDVDKTRLATAPVNVSINAQPEQPRNYDGVLGPAFLIGLPLLVYALWKLDLGAEVRIMAGVAAVMYFFWLFSSEQLRYLLPIVPLLAIAIAASVEKIGGSVAKVAKCGLVAASVAGLLTSLAWFCQKAPLRVVLGGETRDQYLTRNLDYYPYYQEINSNAPADAKVWLINMRRDTYHIDRPVVSDYLFEDWTLRKMLWESRNSQELEAKAAALGVQYILARHDFLFDYDRSSLVDDKRPRGENEAKLAMAKDLILDPRATVKRDDKFSLVKLY